MVPERVDGGLQPPTRSEGSAVSAWCGPYRGSTRSARAPPCRVCDRASRASTGSTTITRLIDIKKPPDEDNVRPSHRHDGVGVRSPIGWVVAASLGVLLWHGGYRSGGQLLLTGIAVACIALVRPRPGLR